MVLSNLVFAAWSGSKRDKTDKTPKIIYILCAICYVTAMLSSNYALKHVNYPTQVPFTIISIPYFPFPGPWKVLQACGGYDHVPAPQTEELQVLQVFLRLLNRRWSRHLFVQPEEIRCKWRAWKRRIVDSRVSCYGRLRC